MINDYKVLGEDTLIYIPKRSGMWQMTIIDTGDLENILTTVDSIGSDNNYAFCRRFGGSNIQMHRLIMKTPKNLVVDHINGNTFDNRKKNLRNCTQTENSHNLNVTKTKNESGIRGILRTRKGWKVHQIYQGKTYNLGTYEDIEKAKDVLRVWQNEFKPYMRWEDAN